MANVRIKDLQEITEITDDMYVPVDNTSPGTRKYNLKTLCDTVEDATASATSAASQANSAATAATTAASTASDAAGRAEDAIEAVGEISELAVPLMSADTRGGAKLGDGLVIEDGVLSVNPDVQQSTGEVRGSIASLTAKGHAEQDGIPTPSSPIPIQVTRGRNLLPTTPRSGTVDAVSFVCESDGTITLNGTATANKAANILTDRTIMLPVGTYTVSVTGSSDATAYIGPKSGALAAGESYTFTISEEYELAQVAKIWVLSERTYNDCKLSIQVERGSTAHNYLPYSDTIGIDITHGSTTTTIPVPLPAKGYAAALPDGTADVLTIDGAGKVEWLNAVNEVVLDGTESWSASSITTNCCYSIITRTNNGRSSGNISAISTHYAYTQSAASSMSDKSFKIGAASGGVNELLYVRDSVNAVSTSTLTAWLAENPVNVLYSSIAPTMEQCGYIDWPTIPDGAVITCPELDALGARYIIGSGVAEMAREWYERARSEYENRITNLESAVAQLIAES